jgi:hypothetical protein
MKTRLSEVVITVSLNRPHRLVLSSRTKDQTPLTIEPLAFGYPDVTGKPTVPVSVETGAAHSVNPQDR